MSEGAGTAVTAAKLTTKALKVTKAMSKATKAVKAADKALGVSKAVKATAKRQGRHCCAEYSGELEQA